MEFILFFVETMRLHPVMLQFQKICTEEYTLPKFGIQKEGVTIYPGTSVIIPIQAIHWYGRIKCTLKIRLKYHEYLFISVIQITSATRHSSIPNVLCPTNAETVIKRILCHSARDHECAWAGALAWRKWKRPWSRSYVTSRLAWQSDNNPFVSIQCHFWSKLEMGFGLISSPVRCRLMTVRLIESRPVKTKTLQK